MLFCPSAETSQADNRTDDFEHWDFARKLLDIPSFTIFIILIVKNKNGTTLQIQRSQKKSMNTYTFNANALNANTATVWTAGSLISLLLFCFLSFFRPSSHNLTAAKHECSSEKIYAHCVHPSALCTSESKYQHESCSCHPPGLCSYLCALLPLKWHGAPREFLMVLLHWFQNGPDPLAACNKSKCAPPYSRAD